MKVCPVCRIEKPFDSFHKNRTKKDLLAFMCKLCKVANDKSYASENKERLSIQGKIYRAENAERISLQRKNAYAEDPKKHNERTLAHYHANKEKINASTKIYREKNADAIRQRTRENYAANSEVYRERQKANRLRDPEKHREKSRLYKLANPDVVAAGNRKRKAMKKGATGTHTACDVMSIFDGQRGLCANCKKKLFRSGAKKFHVDHVMPLAKGGSNDKYNLQLLCPSCNLSKHSKDPIDWAQENGRLL
jgi:5-methylcytosine-specific restriction endonuclease McrA